MGDRQWPDPRGWEALTQEEAEQDVLDADVWQFTTTKITDDDCPCLKPSHKRLEEALAQTERERDEAREALREAVLWLVVPSDIPEHHHEALGRAREQIRAALAEGPQA